MDDFLKDRLNNCTALEREVIKHHFIENDTGKLYSYFFDEAVKDKLDAEYRYRQIQYWPNGRKHEWHRDAEVFFNAVDCFDLANIIIGVDNHKYNNSDNLRVALVGDELTEALYRKAKSKGCCGFYDEVYDINGKQYRIGFNYGH